MGYDNQIPHRRNHPAGAQDHARLQPVYHGTDGAGREEARRKDHLNGKVFFANSGAESNEGAIQARAASIPSTSTVRDATRS